jgi:hypothetical protein
MSAVLEQQIKDLYARAETAERERDALWAILATVMENVREASHAPRSR